MKKIKKSNYKHISKAQKFKIDKELQKIKDSDKKENKKFVNKIFELFF